MGFWEEVNNAVTQANNIRTKRPEEFWATLNQVRYAPLHLLEAGVRKISPVDIPYDVGMSGMFSDSNTYAPFKLWAGDILYDWGKNRGMLSQDIPPDVAYWLANRALTSPDAINNPDGTVKIQQGPFYWNSPGYVDPATKKVDWAGAPFIANNTVGSIDVYDPKTKTLKDEGWDFRESYKNWTIPQYWDMFMEGKVSPMGMLGKIGYEYGTKDTEGLRQDLKLKF